MRLVPFSALIAVVVLAVALASRSSGGGEARPTTGKGAMPAWRGDLTTKEIRKVVEYTRTGLGQ